jgi:hypothetical protein
LASRDFKATTPQLLTLTLLAFVVPCLANFLQTPAPKEFVVGAVMCHASINLVLFGAIFCFAHALKIQRRALWISVALLAVSLWPTLLHELVIGLLSESPLLQSDATIYLYFAALGLWAYVYSLRVLQSATGLGLRRLAAPLIAFLLVTLGARFGLPYIPFWYTEFDAGTSYQPSPQADVESIHYQQAQLMADASAPLRPQRDEVSDVYFVGFGSYAEQDVFMKEVAFVQDVVEGHFAEQNRSIRLINNAQTVHDTPLANVSNLADALKAIGQDIDNDVLFLYLTSHGSRDGVLSVRYNGLNPHQFDAQGLRKILDDSSIRWRIVVISACYAGSFIEALKDPHTLVLTAARKDRTSFGCSNDRELTYFAEHLCQQELATDGPLFEAFERARTSLTARETLEGHKASDPQRFVGKAMIDKLVALEAQAQTRR